MNLPLLLLLVTVLIVVVAALRIVRGRWLGKRVPKLLRAGRPLPDFEAVDEQGNAVSSKDLRGAPAVILFVRGNWCPFCSRQVASLTEHYKAIGDLGARLILITPKPLQTTRRVAEMFDVDFDFWLDEDLSIARSLGIHQAAGVPASQQADFGTDTVWPTSLVVDADGVIRHTELSRFIVDRPNAASLVAHLRKL